ncbi:Peptidase, trypsin-like protein, partial [Aureobasidium melanogenum]
MDGQQNGEARVKRKEHPSSSQDRPLKQLRSDATAEEPVNGFSQDDEADAQPVMHAATTDSVEWQRTIETVVSKVVSIHFCQTSAFDTDPALSSEATGFVVDAENGYILTNRHVVGSGPFWGYCIFDNHEECDVYPVYRDPVHDFGFLK